MKKVCWKSLFLIFSLFTVLLVIPSQEKASANNTLGIVGTALGGSALGLGLLNSYALYRNGAFGGGGWGGGWGGGYYGGGIAPGMTYWGGGAPTGYMPYGYYGAPVGCGCGVPVSCCCNPCVPVGCGSMGFYR